MFNIVVAIGTILLQISIVIGVISWIIQAPYLKYIARHAGILLATLFTAATLLSLIYQYGFGYEPCLLCWYQRIAIIPIAILGWTANLRSSKLLQRQILSFAILGALIALFHVYIDVFPTGIDVCGTSTVSCTIRYVYEFGYITIPVMSLTVLAAGIFLTLLARRYKTA